MLFLKFWLVTCALLCVSRAYINQLSDFRNILQQVKITIVDDMLLAYKDKLVQNGNHYGKIRLDDIKLNVPLPLTDAKIWLTQGILSNVLTVRKIGPVEVNYYKAKNLALLKAHIGLDYLKVTFDTFKVKLPLFDRTAKLIVDVYDTALEAVIIIEEKPCRAYLKDLKLLSFKRFIPHVVGMKWGITNSVAELIIKGVGSYLSTFSKSTLEQYFYNQVSDAVEYTNICKYFY